jgi:hypothetical protein
VEPSTPGARPGRVAATVEVQDASEQVAAETEPKHGVQQVSRTFAVSHVDFVDMDVHIRWDKLEGSCCVSSHIVDAKVEEENCAEEKCDKAFLAVRPRCRRKRQLLRRHAEANGSYELFDQSVEQRCSTQQHVEPAIPGVVSGREAAAILGMGKHPGCYAGEGFQQQVVVESESACADVADDTVVDATGILQQSVGSSSRVGFKCTGKGRGMTSLGVGSLAVQHVEQGEACFAVTRAIGPKVPEVDSWEVELFEEAREVLQEIRSLAEGLQDLVGKSRRRQGRFLRHQVARFRPLLQRVGGIEEQALLAEVELYLDL